MIILRSRRGSFAVEGAVGILFMFSAIVLAADLSIAGHKAMELERAVDESARLAATNASADQGTLLHYVTRHLAASRIANTGLDVSLQTLVPGNGDPSIVSGRGSEGQYLLLTASLPHDFLWIPGSITLRAKSHVQIE